MDILIEVYFDVSVIELLILKGCYYVASNVKTRL